MPIDPPLPAQLPHPDAPQVESAIGKLYAEGHAYNFKAPEDGSVSPLFQSQASQ